ncbi:hypothetical protein [Nocardioides montaniterrae]
MTNLGAIPRILVTTGRLLRAHWPALLALALFGMAMREASLWAAVKVSDWNSFVAQLLLIAAPLGYLLPVIGMLDICRGSLPRASAADAVHAPDAPNVHRERRLVDVAVGVLIPFLTVYAALGLHDEDFNRFFNSAAFDELSNIFSGHYDIESRLGWYPLRTVIVIVIVSWVVRWLLGMIESRTGFFALAILGALVETYYTAQLVNQVKSGFADFSGWLSQRRVWVGIHDGYERFIDSLGFIAGPVDGVVSAVMFVFSQFELVLIVPAAWLAVSAVVLGHKLIPAPAPADLPLKRAGHVIQEIGDTLFDDIMDRWAVFWHGVTMVFRTGFATIAVFSAIFLVAARMPFWFSHLVRWVVGPTEKWTYLSFSTYEQAVGLALSAVLIAPLLAAATEWLVLPAATAIADEARRSRDAASGTSATPA